MSDVLFTDVGISKMITHLSGVASTRMTHLAYGTGTTDPAYQDTALGTEVGTRATLVKTVNGKGMLVSGVIGSQNGSGAITEYGHLDASASGNLFIRGLTASYTKDTDTNLTVETIVYVDNTGL